MKELELSRHEQAQHLHQQIITSGSLAAQNLFDMANALKDMRDGKLYKEIGYERFEDYCESEVGMKQSNAYRYISIAERIKSEKFPSMGKIGMTKLSLIASLSEEKQTEIAEAVDLESVSVRELKEEINKLKGMKMRLENLQAKLEHERDEAAAKLAAEAANAEEARKQIRTLEIKSAAEMDRANRTADKLRDKEREAARLERENKELRERPVEVAVEDRSEKYDRKLAEAFEALEAERRRSDEERRSRKKDHDDELKKLRDEYEAKMKAAAVTAETPDKGKQEFKIFLVMAHDALERLIAAANGKDEIYKEKIRELLKAAEQKL